MTQRTPLSLPADAERDGVSACGSHNKYVRIFRIAMAIANVKHFDAPLFSLDQFVGPYPARFCAAQRNAHP